ncbi:two-component system, chemotaxis family, response regulator CheY [Geoalkalibacter ferrihydriticus]|uniref:Chemotaxis protein CheY n=2 Tax=Geoalkalibacter ferrihydriticus TaxID=392333 RepID=A0A0C2HRE4_9BACT|nr:response regulator [Geoalkalibacter ferrihydriticus]KIH75352.1 chemotaxis protein CheY [Geoalkalibacter ferrihydriticus DSM 17813]SDM96909.1 two-component system, chemotaxis family, response regulator CheY [Geoalkalibacter ferrihydriticus]
MRILIVEDDFTSRRLMHKLLENLGECDLAVNGAEAVAAFEAAHRDGRPYRLICLDIMMPEMDGQDVLKLIRRREGELGVAPRHEARVIMTTALDQPRDVVEAFYRGGCTDYLVKPIDKKTLLEKLRECKVIVG